MNKLIVRLLIVITLLEPAAHLLLHETDHGATFNHSYALTYNEHGYWQPADYISATLNIEHGERVTVGQPAVYKHSVYVYGNSITFGFNVADADTIPSQLQKLTDYRVVNRSVIGQAARGYLAWLKDSPPSDGDIVIFGGSSDLEFAKDKARPIAPWLRAECARPMPDRTVITLFAVLCQGVQYLPIDQRVYQYYVNDYHQTLAEAESYTKQHGATFLLLNDVSMPTAPDLYVDIYGHFNEQGAVLAARSIYDRLTIY